MFKYPFSAFTRCGMLLLLLCCCSNSMYAQQFGGNPPSVKWKQLNTPTTKVIFSQGLDSSAFRVAQLIEKINAITLPSLGNKQKKISIVLHGQTTISNAYVGLAPFRSEFYLTPEQNSFEIGSLPWADQLAIHEFRHVQQYNNFRVGASKALSILFGQGGQAIANNIAVPDWFFEGDAVFNETLVSQQGRGRMPYFYNGFRALWNAKKDYSWMKLRNGSYRDFVPNWYPMGYMLVAYGREKYGDDFWGKVTHDAASFKGVFYPMQQGIKRHSGVDFDNFRTGAFNYFKQPYAADKQTTNYKNNQHFIANIEYPAFVDDSTLLYMKTTYDNLPQFTLSRGDKESKISVRSRSLDNYFDYRNGKVVYAAYNPDIRWGFRDYSELRVLDINTHKEERLTRHTRYFSPAFNADRSRIVAVQVTAGKSQLHIIDAEKGTLMREVPNRDNLFFTYPKFYNDSQLIAPVRNEGGKMTIALITINTGEVKYLLPFSSQPIGFPTLRGDMLYFSATTGINDKLFALNVSSVKLYEIDRDVNSLNRYQPTATETQLAWVEFTAYGYRLNRADRSSLHFARLLDELPGSLPTFGVSTLAQSNLSDLSSTVAVQPLPVTKYNKAYQLLNFHSLVPELSDPNYSLSLVGENVLNTFQSQINFNYNRDEGYKQFGAAAIYGGLYPYIRVGGDYTLDRRAYYNGGNIYFDETDIHAGLLVPLNLSNGKNVRALSIGSDLYYSQNIIPAAYSKLNLDKAYVYANSYVTFSNYIQQAKKNIFPRFGQSISVNYKSTIDRSPARQLLISGSMFLPGLLINHNLVLTGAHQQKNNNNAVNFSNNFPFSRGYTAQNLHSMDKISANYHFPIAYPDAGVANTLYFLRIRGNIYYDYSHVSHSFATGPTFRADFRSAGAEVYFDTKWFNQQPLTFGVRYSYLLDRDYFGGGGNHRIEVILPVSFF